MASRSKKPQTTGRRGSLERQIHCLLVVDEIRLPLAVQVSCPAVGYSKTEILPLSAAVVPPVSEVLGTRAQSRRFRKARDVVARCSGADPTNGLHKTKWFVVSFF